MRWLQIAVILLALQPFSAFAGSSFCSDYDQQNLSLSEEAIELGERDLAVETLEKVSRDCQLGDDVVDRTLAVLTRACDFHRGPNVQNQSFFLMLSDSSSNVFACNEGVDIVNTLGARRPLTPKEELSARALALGDLTPFAEYVFTMVHHGGDPCLPERVSDSEIQSIISLVQNFTIGGAGKTPPFEEHQQDLQAYYSAYVPLDPNQQLLTMRKMLSSMKFGFGTCQAVEFQYCCPPRK